MNGRHQKWIGIVAGPMGIQFHVTEAEDFDEAEMTLEGLLESNEHLVWVELAHVGMRDQIRWLHDELEK